MASPIDKQKLRDLASKATPGEWRHGTVEKHHVFVEWMGHERVLLRMNTHFPHFPHDAAFIAAASPSTVISLLDENDRLRKLVRDAVDIAKQADWYAMPSGYEVAEVHEETIAYIEKELNGE